MNSRNYKNPTVIAWEQLRQMLTQFADRMKNFDVMVQNQGRDVGVDEVYNEIQNIRKELNEIQKGLNLQNNTINTERVVDKSQPEIPFEVTNNDRNDESKNMDKKLIRLTESDLHKIVKESVNRVLTELDWKTYASAAKKRGIQGDPKGTMHDLSNAATRALRDSHPTDGHKYNDEYPSIETFNDDYHGHAQKGMVPGLGSYNPYDGIPTDTYVDEFDKDRESWKRLNRRPDALQRDMDGYFSGKSQYVKGKGWQ